MRIDQQFVGISDHNPTPVAVAAQQGIQPVDTKAGSSVACICPPDGHVTGIGQDLELAYRMRLEDIDRDIQNLLSELETQERRLADAERVYLQTSRR